MNPIVKPQVTDAAYVKETLLALTQRYRFLNTLCIGHSAMGKELPALVFGNGLDKVVYAAAFHGQEWMTAWILLRLCENICRSVETGEKIDDMDFKSALKGRCLIMIPMVNPDGVDIAIHGSSSARAYASCVAELGGDIPGLWQANARGVDINHNFNAGWNKLQESERKQGIDGPAPRQWGGPFPESEPETSAMVNFCRSIHIRHVIALHSQGEEIYWRYGKNTPARSRLMAEIMASSSGYTVADPEGLASHGGFKDWFIEETGRPGFTIELGKGVNPLPVEEFEAVYAKAEEMLLLSALM